MTPEKAKPQRVMYITAAAPLSDGEVWAVREMLAVLRQGIDLVVVPRTSDPRYRDAVPTGVLPGRLVRGRQPQPQHG